MRAKPFQHAPGASIRYARALRRVSRQVGGIIASRSPSVPGAAALLQRDLTRYADGLDAWAAIEAATMLTQVGNANRLDFGQVLDALAKKALADWLRGDEMATPAIRRQAATNVLLIRSIPLEAASRIARVSAQGEARGWAHSRLEAAWSSTSGMATTRATAIAEDMVHQAAQAFTSMRAQAIGSPGYAWRTRRDRRVRPSHAAMDGVFVAWGLPPRLNDGTAWHAGCAPHCRCYAEPVIRRR